MHPVLIHLGPVTIRTYGFLYALGLLLGVLVALRLARREGIDPDRFLDFIFWTLVVSVLGAKLFLVLTNLGYYQRYPSELKLVIISGGVFYGGLLFGIPFAAWLIRRKKLPFRSLGDASLPGLAFGHFFGRLGCFAAGCCFGRPAPGFPLACTFTSEQAHALSGTPLHIALYPTQLIEAAANLLNFLFLLWLFPRRRYKGQVVAWYLFNYSVIRFMIEYLRGDGDRGFVLGGPHASPASSLSTAQAISVGGVILALVLMRSFRKKGEQENLS